MTCLILPANHSKRQTLCYSIPWQSFVRYQSFVRLFLVIAVTGGLAVAPDDGQAQIITEIIDSTGDGLGNGLSALVGIAVDGAGNVYVAGFGSHNAFKITPGGSITEIINSTGDGVGNGLAGPSSIAVDGAGNVYVAAQVSNNAFKITPGGSITEIINSTGDGVGNGLLESSVIAVDGAGNVYVAGLVSNNIFKITPGGSITKIIDSTSFGIAVDGAGNVYVAGADSNNAFKITPGGSITEIIDSTGDGAGNGLDQPHGIAVDGAGNVYVTGLVSNNAFKITPGGSITEIINNTGDGVGNGLLRGIAVDGAGNVYVAGGNSNNAFKITPGGSITEIINSTGDGVGNGLHLADGIAVDGAGNVYVAGFGSNNAFKIVFSEEQSCSATNINDCEYVALGDSYSSGEGTKDYEKNPMGDTLACHRSPHAYSQVTSQLSLTADETFFACSGARTFNVSPEEPDGGVGQNGELPQLDQEPIDENTDIVTLTIGGNDAGFAALLKKCIIQNDCQTAQVKGKGMAEEYYPQHISNKVGPDVSTLLQQVQAAAPNAVVYLLGYPPIFPTEENDQKCSILQDLAGPGWKITPKEQNFLLSLGRLLNDALQAAAQAQGVHFVPVTFDGHEICPPETSWFVPPRFGPHDRVEFFHPTQTGQRRGYRKTWEEFLGRTAFASASSSLEKAAIQDTGAKSVSKTTTLSTLGELVIEPADLGCTTDAVVPGQTLQLKGDGFQPMSSVTLELSTEPPHELAVVAADNTGAIDVVTIVPLGLSLDPLVMITALGTGENLESRLLEGFLTIGEPLTVDEDFDGVPNICDVCPQTPDTDQTDTDGDLIGDACDACPFDSGNDSDGDGLCANVDLCPHDETNDGDGDGLCAEVDNCPLHNNPTQADVDNDFIGDACDLCPDIPGESCNFLFYKTKTTRGTPKFVKFGPITLEDQFGPADYNVLRPTRLGLPANKNGEGVSDSEGTHLKEYQLQERAKGADKFRKLSNVRISNQCNDLLLEVIRPDSILVPTNKDLVVEPLPPAPGILDHYLCYTARVQVKDAAGNRLPSFPRGIQIEVEDQFQDRRYDLKKITKLCNPVNKSGTPEILAGPDKDQLFPIEPATILNPDDHLVCYQAGLATKFIEQAGCGPVDPNDHGTTIRPRQERHEKRTGVHVNNQFGPKVLDTIKEDELCIPSQKILE